MSVVGGVGGGTGLRSWLRGFEANARAGLVLLTRAERGPVALPPLSRIALVAAVACTAIVLTMALLDRPLLAAAPHLPRTLINAFDDFTNFGRSGWFLFPLGAVLLALLVLDWPRMSRIDRGVLAAFAVRLSFAFAAIGLPSLFVSIVKRLIGRARPLSDAGDVWSYMPFIWKVQYASFPSGHATTAFSALVAIGALFPEARALMWIYALLLAASRVVTLNHHPSDVLAGAIVGAVGALMVRNWYAARRIGFTVGRDGAVRSMPGPGWQRIARAVARSLHTA